MDSTEFKVVHYRGFKIDASAENNIYYGMAYKNGTCLVSGIKSNSIKRCVEKCKEKIDEIFHYEIDVDHIKKDS